MLMRRAVMLNARSNNRGLPLSDQSPAVQAGTLEAHFNSSGASPVPSRRYRSDPGIFQAYTGHLSS